MPTLTWRSAIRFGGNAVVITLPKAWVDYYGVEPGDRLQVVAGDVLVIHPPPLSKTSGYPGDGAQRTATG